MHDLRVALRLLRVARGAPGDMVLFRVIIGTIWVSLLLIGRGMWTPDAPVNPWPAIGTHVEAPLHGASKDEHLVDAAAPRLDLYGNPVEPAVGDYRTDRRGDLYERHDPDTALLRLGPAGV